MKIDRYRASLLALCLLALGACSKDEPTAPVGEDYPQHSSGVEHLLAARDGSPQIAEEWGGLYYVMNVPAEGGTFKAGLSPEAARVSGDKRTPLTYWPFVPASVHEVIWSGAVSYPECLRPEEGAAVSGVMLCNNEAASRFLECEALSWVTQPQLDEFEVEVRPNRTGHARQLHVNMQETPMLQPFQFVIMQAAE